MSNQRKSVEMLATFQAIEELPDLERTLVEDAFAKHKLRLDTFEEAEFGFDDPDDPDRRDEHGRFQKRLVVLGSNFSVVCFYNKRATSSHIEWDAERVFS